MNINLTNQIILESKKILLDGLCRYISDKKTITMITKKIQELNIVILNETKFLEKYKEYGGKGIAPKGFNYNGTIYLQNYNLNKHNIIHEILHAISEYNFENGYKHGLSIGNKTKNYSYGRSINESFTEYLTSIISNEEFNGYSIDFKYMLELFMDISDLKIEDTLELYLKEDEWLSEDVINQFDELNESLPELIIEYDKKSPYVNNEFNPNIIMKIFLNAIENKINKNNNINSKNIIENLKNIYNYFYTKDYELDNEIKIKMSNIIDILGTYTSNFEK